MIARTLFAACVLALLVMEPAAQDKPAMTAVLVDELVRLYPDRNEATPAPTRLDTPRGSYAAVHVLIENATVGDSLALGCTGADGLALRWYRLIDGPVEFNTGLEGWTTARKPNNENPHVTRKAPFRTYDAMQPVTSPVEMKAATTVLRAEFAVPGNATPGKREITLTVGALKLSIALHVHAAIVPPAGKDTFCYTNWMDWSYSAGHYGLKPWSDEHWDAIRRYVKLMHRARQNTFCIWLWLVFDGVTPGPGPGENPTLNRERLGKLVQLLTEEGIWWLEGGHLAARANGDWFADHFQVWGKRGTSPEGNELLAQTCKQLMEEIKANGWEDRWIQHVVDEPIPENATDYRILTGMVRKYMPGIPTLDAVMDTNLAGSVDIWCPKVHEYQQGREFYERQRKVGDRIWVYTCLHPGGKWMNRTLDFELLRPLLIGWACAKFGIDGFLHWGLNQWNEDPLKVGNQKHGGEDDARRLPAGDTHIAYAGDLASGPWSSLRMEAHRTGFEDLEMLRALRAKDAARHDAIMQQVCRGFDDYTLDVAHYRDQRRALLQALSD